MFKSLFSSAPAIAGFADLSLNPALLETLSKIGFSEPTPIQAKAIPVVLTGKDLIGNAQTGTGKTGAFVLPILTKLMADSLNGLRSSGPEVLILAPTRELASQIHDSVKTFARGTKINSSVIFGGVGQMAQTRDLERNFPRILVATPGRLLDLMGQGFIDLSSVNVLVLDEADRMLDMGFIHDIRRIVKVIPTERQTLLFSATMPKDIVQLANQILRSPERVAVDPVSSAVELIEQSVILVNNSEKRSALLDLLQQDGVTRAIVFTRTKHVADRIQLFLEKSQITCRAIHANKSQGARTHALKGFKSGEIPVLVATDIAARGIDVDDVSHVINYDLPEVPETYVHRIGRTGRAKKVGVAISLCDNEQRRLLNDIERHLGKSINYLDRRGRAPGSAQGSDRARGHSPGSQGRFRSEQTHQSPAAPKPQRHSSFQRY